MKIVSVCYVSLWLFMAASLYLDIPDDDYVVTINGLRIDGESYYYYWSFFNPSYNVTHDDVSIINGILNSDREGDD